MSHGISLHTFHNGEYFHQHSLLGSTLLCFFCAAWNADKSSDENSVCQTRAL